MTNYYYILSSLPNLSLDGRPDETALDKAFDLIMRQCDQADLEHISWFLYRNESYNLIEYWQQLYGHIEHRPLRKPYGHKTSDFNGLDQNLEILPPFLRSWYEEQRERIPHWNLNRIETEVLSQFFQAAEALEDSPFVRDYFNFEHQLRGLMASFHQGEYSFIDQDRSFSNHAIVALLRRRPLTIRQEDQLTFPFLEDLIHSLSSKDPKQISLAVHQVLWQEADDLAQGHYFDRFALLNYVAKLFLLYRREQLFQNQEEPKLQSLVKSALQNIEVHD